MFGQDARTAKSGKYKKRRLHYENKKGRRGDGQEKRTTPQSIYKTYHAVILLFGNKQRKEFWVLFEVLLTQYVQSLTEHPSELLKSKNSAEG